MSSSSSSPLPIGLATGLGTGPELAAAFTTTIQTLAALYSVPITLLRPSKQYQTYFSHSTDPRAISAASDADVAHYTAFLRDVHAKGCRVVFRTAINAQSLYAVREQLEAVKVERFVEKGARLVPGLEEGVNGTNGAVGKGRDGRMLLVRDQAQGFYAGRNTHSDGYESVSRPCVFSRELMGKVVRFAVEKARAEWGAIETVTLVYKFHLFDGVFGMWAKGWEQELGVKIEIVQPDTANRNLLLYGLRGRDNLVVAGNEWADIMHVVLLDRFGGVTQETRCTENVLLGLEGMKEWQTVHGSADDIAGLDVVNPAATMRAAACILEREGGVKGLESLMDQTLDALEYQGIATRDRGGRLRTTELVEQVLDTVKGLAVIPTEAKL